jgi:hypothetical protein
MLTVPFRERLTCTVPEAMAAVGLGRTSIYLAIADGRLTVSKFGKRTLVSVPSLLQLVGQASSTADSPTPKAV